MSVSIRDITLLEPPFVLSSVVGGLGPAGLFGRQHTRYSTHALIAQILAEEKAKTRYYQEQRQKAETLQARLTQKHKEFVIEEQKRLWRNIYTAVLFTEV